MKHSYFLLSAALCLGVSFGSQADNMSLGLRQRLALEAGPVALKPAADARIPVIVSVTDASAAQALSALGLNISSQFGGTIIGNASVKDIAAIASHPSVLVMDEARQVFPNLDLVKPAVSADIVQNGAEGLVGKNGVEADVIPFTGKGVIVGIADTGIQPGHPAFYNNERTELRIKQYIVTESGNENGTKEVSAKIYDKPGVIKIAQSQPYNNGHGTHVAGIAGGSYPTQDFRGVAPESDLVISNMGQSMYADEVLYSINHIIEYAKEKQQPLVLNLSLGSIQGSHNGTGAMANAVDELVGPGAIVCFAGGNDGMYYMSLLRDFSKDKAEVKTCLTLAQNLDTPSSSPTLQFLSQDETTFEVAFAVVDKATKTEIYSTKYFTADDFSSSDYKILYSTFGGGEQLDPDVAKYIGGNIRLTSGVDRTAGQFAFSIVGSVSQLEGSTRYLAVKVKSDAGAKVLMLSCNTYAAFFDPGVRGYTSGSPANTIADYATIKRVISVGAINARESWTTLDGTQGTLNTSYYGPLMGPANYSSYGIRFDADAEKLPIVAAPGTYVISAFNGRATSIEARRCIVNNFENKDYYWGLNTGSSMATPAVSGVIALWLEACPTLTPEQVKEVIAATSQKTDLVKDSPRTGAGIIDAYEGLKYIYAKYVDVSSVSSAVADVNRVMVRYTAPRSVECVIPAADKDATVYLYDMQGRTIRSFSTRGEAAFNLDLPEAGAYILRVTTGGKAYTQRLLAK